MRLILLTLLCLITTISFSQNTDCAEAEIICNDDDIVFNPNGAGIDDFADPDNDPGCIVANESNSAWYYFQIDPAAPVGLQLGFTISPNGGLGEDYDWALFGPDVSCGNLGSPLRCSSASAACDFCPDTGVGMGATDLSEGPGVGDGFTALVDVVPGQGFYLMIDNWAGTNNGFMMTWTGTAAEHLDCNAQPPCALFADAGADITACEDGNSFVLNGTSGGNGGGESYSWTGTNGGTAYLDNPNSANPTVTLPPGFNGTITYTLNVNENLCADSDEMVVTVNPAPLVTLNPAGPICQNSDATLLSANPPGGTWTGATNGWFDPLVAGPGPHVVTYSFTDANNCSGSASITINVNSNPSVSINPSPADFCTNDGGIILTANAIGGTPNYNYTWVTPNGSATGPTYVATSAGSYFVTASDANSCFATDEITVTEFPNPIVTIIDPGEICESVTTYQLMAAPSGGTWTGGTVTPSGEIFPSIIGAGTYNVTYNYTDFNNCSASTNMDIIVTAPPSSEPSNNGPYCAGQAIELLGNTNVSGPNVSFIWTGPNGYSSSVQNPTDATEAGPYLLQVIVNGCFSEVGLTTVTLSASPEATASNSGPYCSGESIQLNGETSNTGTIFSYSWTGPGGYTSTAQNPSDATLDGNYELVITIDGCPSSPAMTIVNFNAAPDAAANNSGPYCTGDNIELTSSTTATGTNITYAWTGPGGYASAVQNPTDATAVGMYAVIINVDGCLSTSTETEVIINPLPSPEITGNASFCAGNSVTLDAGVYEEYLWNDGTILQTLGVGSSGTYIVTVTDANGCTGVDQITVTENPNPVPTITGESEFCEGTSSVCVAPPGYAAYLWSDNSTADSIVVTTGGIYSLTVTDANGCTGTNQVNITVFPNPTPTISGQQNICEGESTTLSTGSYNSYSWSDGSSNQSIDVSSAGTYSVIVTDENGCIGSTSFTVTEDQIPEPTISGDESFCEGSSSSLNAGNYDSYEWSDGSINQTIEVTTSGTYSVTVSNPSGCTGETEINITVNPNPAPSIAGSTSFCSGSSTTLDAGSGYSNYEWSDGSSDQTLTVSTAGDYSVIVTDLNGCTGEVSVLVTESSSLNPVISGALEYCIGSNTTLDAGAGFNSYLWSDGSQNQTLTVSTEGDFTVTVTDGSGCSGETTVNIIENELPIINISGNDPICTGEQITLDAGAGFDTYTWSNTSLNQTINVTDGGNYTVEVSDANGCTNEATIEVIENPNPVPIITGDQSFCTGDIVTLDAGIFDQYEWSDGTNDSTLEVTTGDSYSVVVTDANGCTGEDQFAVTENQLPTPTILGDAEYCAGESTTISISQDFEAYVWSDGSITQEVNINAPGNIDVVVTDINGCVGTNNLFIIENPNPEPIISGSMTFCTGNSTFLDAGNGYTQYMWSNGTLNQTLEVSVEGPYSVIVTDANGCTGEAFIDVTESQSLEPVISGDLSLCTGEVSTLDAGSGFATYLWSTGAITQSIEASSTDNYTVTVSDTQGCTGEGTVTLIVNPSPSVTIVGEDNFCSGDQTTLDAGNGYDAYLWSDGSITQTIDVTIGGNYTVTVTSAGDCTAETSILVIENQAPTPSISGANSFCTGNSVTLDAGDGYTSYLWSDGSITQTVTVSTTTDISVMVTDANGCSGSDQMSISENASLTPTITGIAEFCEGGNSILDAGSGYTQYEWSTGEMTQTITVEDGNTYTVIVTDADGCSGSDNLIVTEFQNPIPVIAGSTTFCTGSSTTLDAGAFDSYLWSDGSITQTITVNTPGEYTVDVIDQNNCSAQAIINVTESTSLNPVISGNLSFCENGNTIIDAGAGFDSYMWSDGSSGQTLEVSVADDYTVTVSDGQGCSGETTVSITETLPPSATLLTNISTCNTAAGGSVLNLYDLVTGGDINGTWTDADNSGAVGLFDNLNFNNIPAGAYNFIYTTNSATFPCTEVTYPVTVTVIDCSCPDVQFFQADPLCNGGETLDLSTIENTTEAGTWTITQSPAGSNPATVTGNIFDATDGDIGSYTLEFQLTNPQPQGCPEEYLLNIIVDPAPVSGVPSMPTELCQNGMDVVDLFGLITGEDPNGSWTETSVTPSQFNAFDPLAATFAVNFQTPGDYTFQYTVASSGACPDAITEVTVTLNPLPEAEVVSTIVNLDCINQSAVINATGSTGPEFEISWIGPGVVIDGNENTFTPTVNQSGIYTMTITNTNTGCLLSDWIQVNDNSNSPTVLVGADQTINCLIDNADLQVAGDINLPFQILWEGPGIDASNENSPTPNVNLPGIYTITISNPDNGCSSSDIIEVFEDIDPPVIVIQSNLEEIDCITPLSDLISESPTPGVSFEWFDDQNNSIGTTAEINGISQGGIYTIIVTADNGCTAMDQIEIINNIEYPASLAGNPSTIDCINTEAVLDGSASSNGANISYVWTGPGISGAIDEAVTNANLPGTYTITVINTDNGCTSVDDVLIDQNIDQPTVILNQPEELDCTIETVSLDGDGSSVGTNFTYAWLDPNGDIISTTLETEVQDPGLYTLAILNTENGCANSSSVLVSQNAETPSSAIIETIDPDCFGEINGFASIVDVTGGTAPYVYSINGSDLSTNPIIGNLPPGTYNVLIQDALGCELEQSITINPGSDVTLDLGGDQSLELGDSVMVEALINIPISMLDTIIWDGPTGLNCGDPDCLEIGVSTFSTIQIAATVIDTNGCTDYELITINMRKSRDVFIPNIFSPDGDGFNDIFVINANESQIQNIPNFRIFNRWGEVIHEGFNIQPNNSSFGWDGSFKGEIMNPGVFIYMVEIEFIDGRTQLYKGDITLLK